MTECSLNALAFLFLLTTKDKHLFSEIVVLGQDRLVSLYRRGLEVNFRRGFDFQGVQNRFLVREIENENDQIAAGNTYYIIFNSTISQSLFTSVRAVDGHSKSPLATAVESVIWGERALTIRCRSSRTVTRFIAYGF